jgi:hypothetical protein
VVRADKQIDYGKAVCDDKSQVLVRQRKASCNAG